MPRRALEPLAAAPRKRRPLATAGNGRAPSSAGEAPGARRGCVLPRTYRTIWPALRGTAPLADVAQLAEQRFCNPLATQFLPSLYSLCSHSFLEPSERKRWLNNDVRVARDRFFNAATATSAEQSVQVAS